MTTTLQTTPVLPFQVPTNRGDLVVHRAPSSPAQRLEAALENIGKLEDAFESAWQKHYVARSWAPERFVLKHPIATGAVTVGIPAVAISAFMYAIGDNVGAFFAPLIASIFTGMGTWGFISICDERRRSDRPKTKEELSDPAKLLAEMPAVDRALVKMYAEEMVASRVRHYGMTPAASEHLREQLEVENADPEDLRASRAASLLRRIETESSSASQWKALLQDLFAEYPGAESTDIASMLLNRFFKNEVCTLALANDASEALYRKLRATQKGEPWG